MDKSTEFLADLMQATLHEIEEYWRLQLDKAHVPEEHLRELYSLLTERIEGRKLDLAYQQGYDDAYLTTTTTTSNPYDPDSAEYDYFSEGEAAAVDEIQNDA